METISGPDLQEGIRVGDLADGGKIAGRVGEDAVVLVRRGDDFFALDAFCTHYHGPLAEGLVVGETLHCPWHHACFELLFRDDVSLAVEAAMERGGSDDAILEIVRRGF